MATINIEVQSGAVNEQNIPGTVYKVDNSLYVLIPEKIRKFFLPLVRWKSPFKIVQVTETKEYVDVTYRFKKTIAQVTSI
jgi:hypothetical protein